MADSVLHVDLDQFLAASPAAPRLRGRPVVVGGDGDPTKRGVVVSTASYRGRAFRVPSGTCLRTWPAARTPSSSRRAAVTEDVSGGGGDAALVRRPVVEELGWDEALHWASAPTTQGPTPGP